MKISELIKQLEAYQRVYGDVEVRSEQTDGRSTWFQTAVITISHAWRWPGKKKFFIISV